jgi:hypothetical protein
MGYGQWVEVRIQAEGVNIKIQHAGVSSGKFHRAGNKDSDMSRDEVNGIVIPSGKEGIVASCGKSNAWAGTQGGFDLWDKDKNIKIALFRWDCPWSSGSNTFDVVDKDSNYDTRYSGGNMKDGAIGNVTITCVKL